MGLLTAFGGQKPQVDRIAADANSAREESGSIIATVNGVERRFATAEGWELRGSPESPILQRTTRVSKFLNIENLVQVMKYASYIAIMAVGITAVIAMGGIDLSIGSIYALAALMGGLTLRYNWDAGWPKPTLGGEGGALGSSGAWFGLLAVGALLVAVGGFFGKSRSRALSPGLSRQAQAGILLAVGALALAYAAWRFFAAMRDGVDVNTPRSTLGVFASVPIAIAVCCLVGAAAGLLNGVMIVGLRVHPFIITLGTMAAYRGLVALPTQSQSVGTFPTSFTEGFWQAKIGTVDPVPAIVAIIVALAGMFVLSRMVLGRRVFAIGGNEVAATYAGIPVGRVKVTVYTIMGALAGLSGCVYLGCFGAWEPKAGDGYELQVIAAAVIGGASLSGGRGSALGAILGAILVQLLDNGMAILGIDPSYNKIVMGVAIIVAVVLDQAKARLVKVGR